MHARPRAGAVGRAKLSLSPVIEARDSICPSIGGVKRSLCPIHPIEQGRAFKSRLVARSNVVVLISQIQEALLDRSAFLLGQFG